MYLGKLKECSCFTGGKTENILKIELKKHYGNQTENLNGLLWNTNISKLI
jgi:hypothetical protein